MASISSFFTATRGGRNTRTRLNVGSKTKSAVSAVKFFKAKKPRFNIRSRRGQFVALGPKVFSVQFFDPILGELSGGALGGNDNALAVTALHVRAEFQDEAGRRACRRRTPWLGS